MSQVGTILVVEDDVRMRRYLATLLEGAGYRVAEAGDAAGALAQLTLHPPDVVVLDLGLPDRDGLEVTRRVREWSAVPILVVSARERDNDKIEALDSGADDYLTKPFSPGELLARVRVMLRRRAHDDAHSNEAVFRSGDLHIDFAARQVTVAGTEVELTPIEYRLLVYLARNAGRVVTYRQILHEVWGPNNSEHQHYVRIYIAHLRRKLEPNSAQPIWLQTEPGVGYRLRVIDS